MAPEIKDLEIKDAAGRTLDGLESGMVQDQEEMMGEKLTLNMGPSHPSTHGVLRIVWNSTVKSSPKHPRRGLSSPW
jgi:NADH-quinone oxidoreductase subunit D